MLGSFVCSFELYFHLTTPFLKHISGDIIMSMDVTKRLSLSSALNVIV